MNDLFSVQAGALSKYLQPETVDAVLRSEAEQEAEDRMLGVAQDKPGSEGTEPPKDGKEKLDLTTGPQPEPEVDLSSATMKAKVPQILQIPAELKSPPDAEPTPAPPTIDLHLHHFQVGFVKSFRV